MTSPRIIRSKPENRYFVMRWDTAQDAQLSFEARGVLCYLLSKPDDWVTSRTDLMREGQCGREKINRILNELKEAGYLAVRMDHDETGRFSGVAYYIYDVPQSQETAPNRDTAKPHDGKPVTRLNRSTAKPHDGFSAPYKNRDVDKKKETDKAAPPKNGSADAAPKPEPVRDTVFELVATRGFGIALDDAAALAAIRAKANWIASWLKGNAVKMNSRDKKKSLPGCAPPMDAAELARFYAWYEGKYQDVSIPTTAGGMAAHVGKFRAANGQRNGSAPTFTPRDGCEMCGGAGVVRGVRPDGSEATLPCPDCKAAHEASLKETVHA